MLHLNCFTKSKKNQHGFTLIEISIALTVIALLVSGILMGRDLIHQGKVKTIIATIAKYDIAVASFFSQYDGLPGDFREAIDYGLGVSGGMGDSSASLHLGDMELDVDTSHVENINFWHHLSKAKLINGYYGGVDSLSGDIDASPVLYGDRAPLTSLRNVGIYVALVTAFSGRNAYIIGIDDVVSTDYELTPLEALMIDVKLDDGLPLSGVVQAPSTFTPSCFLGAPSEYNVPNDLTSCVVFIRMRM